MQQSLPVRATVPRYDVNGLSFFHIVYVSVPCDFDKEITNIFFYTIPDYFFWQQHIMFSVWYELISMCYSDLL